MSRRSHSAVCCALFLLLAVAPAFAAGEAPEVLVAAPTVPSLAAQTALDATFYDYATFELDTRAIERQVQDGRVRLHLGNQVFDLTVELNDLRAPGYREVLRDENGAVIELPPSLVTTYRGQVTGDDASIVRLNVLADLFEGYVKTTSDWIYIDPLSDYDRSSPRHHVVVYRDENLRPDSLGACGTGRLQQQAAGLGHDHLDTSFSLPGQGVLGGNTLQVATDCDGEYRTLYGNPGAFNRMTAVLNAVDGIYESEINTSVNIVFQQCWTNSGTDPYTSTNASTQLNQFRSWWNANMGGTARDVAHHFSAKDFSGSTIGIAWVGVICNAPSYSYGVVQDLSSATTRRRVSAHEIGHNLSANHDNQAPVCPGVSCNGSGPLMCASIQSSSGAASDDFSNCSRNSINNHIAVFGSCL